MVPDPVGPNDPPVNAKGRFNLRAAGWMLDQRDTKGPGFLSEPFPFRWLRGSDLNRLPSSCQICHLHCEHDCERVGVLQYGPLCRPPLPGTLAGDRQYSAPPNVGVEHRADPPHGRFGWDGLRESSRTPRPAPDAPEPGRRFGYRLPRATSLAAHALSEHEP